MLNLSRPTGRAAGRDMDYDMSMSAGTGDDTEAMDIRPLSEALGAEVVGLDLTREPAAEAVETLRRAFLDHHLLCFRSEPLDARDFARLARCFGEPKPQLHEYHRHPDAPDVSILDTTYHTAADKPDDLRLVSISGWHTDDSYFAEPAKATMLQALELPGTGSETQFCNMHAAYDDLAPETKARLDGLTAVHVYDTPRWRGADSERTAAERTKTPDVEHPLVRRHDETGRKAIYYNGNRIDRVAGLGRDESDALLDMIGDHATQTRYRYDHAWRRGDILLWDNRSLIHRVDVDHPVGARRVHQRLLLAGGRPLGAAAAATN